MHTIDAENEKVLVPTGTIDMQMKLQTLQSIFPNVGKVDYISIRPQRLQPVIAIDSVWALEDQGLEGDHYNNRGGSRQVTFIQAEHLKVLESFLHRQIDPALTRRNIVISDLNLLSLKGQHFQIGDAVFQYSGECHPCSRMETDLGNGAYNAMRGHGGITAKVIRTGVLKIFDSVRVVGASSL
jgi:MOSC domain-containing protein YiiM